MKQVFFVCLVAVFIVVYINSVQPAKAGTPFFKEYSQDCQQIDGHWGTKIWCSLSLFDFCTAEDCTDPICNPPDCGGDGGGGGTDCDPNCPTCGINCDPWAK